MPSYYSTFELKDDLINLNYYTSRGFCLAKINQAYICLFYKVTFLSLKLRLACFSRLCVRSDA